MLFGSMAGTAHAAIPAPLAQAAGEIEVLGFSASLKLDGKEYVVVNDQVVPAEGISAQGSTFPPSGFHNFTRASPTWLFSDTNGNGSEQMKYSNNREQWGYQISPAVQAIIVGLVSQDADRYHGNTIKHYAHHDVGAAYFHHGSSGGIESAGTYATTFRATFRHNVGPGGNGVLSAQWNWQRR
jgi:hypothetical protein